MTTADTRPADTRPADDTMTIREMCEAFDVTPRTLRFYEAKELLRPIRIGTRRLFTRRDRARLKLILRGRRFGFSLEDIRQLLDLYSMDQGERVQLRRTYELALTRLAEMTKQRDELNQAIAELQEQIDWGARTLAQMENTGAAA